MPPTRQAALSFLETQWSQINDNKIKGIVAEHALKAYLTGAGVQFIAGGWIHTPGNASLVPVAAREKVCVIPREQRFTWQTGGMTPLQAPSLTEISAYSFFRQMGLQVFFAQPAAVVETQFALPKRSSKRNKARYPASYALEFFAIGQNNQLQLVSHADVFHSFPLRSGNTGLRCNGLGRLNPAQAPFDDPDVVGSLFWFEYARYFTQRVFMVSNNDLDLFVIGPSGRAYPVEMKSKTPAADGAFGRWFGLDMGPFAKMAFFTANAMHSEALYVVEEVDEDRAHVEWHGILFTELVKACSWVGQAGGPGMTGGRSATFKIPVAAFQPLDQLLPHL